MKIEEQLRETIRMQGLSDKTFDAYWHWVKEFLLFARQKRGQWVHPSELRERQVEIWLKHLANDLNVSANTQNQAFSALCYLYRHIIKQPLEGVSAMRAKRPDRVRDVLDQSELIELFDQLRGPALLASRMMYASGFRIGEIGEIRMKDISFERKQFVIRGGKGQKDRVVKFPVDLHESVRIQMDSMKQLWRRDFAEGRNGVSLPNRFGVKSPSSHKDFAWYYLFSSEHESKCPHTGRLLRHHQDMGHVARQIKNAASKCGFAKRVTSHCLRHSFATHSIENGVPIHFVQRLLGHSNLETTEGYLHASTTGATSAKSPLESLLASPNSVRDESHTDLQKSDVKATKLKLFVG
jgi:integron integrase